METKKSFFKKLHLANLRYKFGFDADADWLFLSIFCALLFIVVSIFNIVFFFHVTKKVDQLPKKAEKATQIIDRDSITDTLRIYEQKEVIFLKLTEGIDEVDEKIPSTLE